VPPAAVQSGSNQNVSPITPLALVPPSEIPPFVIDPSAVPTKVLHGPPVWSQKPPTLGFSGFLFGTIHGFTQRGCTGVIVPVTTLPTLPESEGLKTSAVAVALTELPVFPQMREKNVGRLARVSCTVTNGLFTPEVKVNLEQSGVGALPPAE